jgi:hypothetical protein
MTQYEIIIALMIAAQLFTAFLLWETHNLYRWYSDAWTRDAAELLFWKRNGILRDPKSGKYVKKARP